MASLSELSWKETKPGIFQRQRGAIEKTFAGIGALGHSLDRDAWSIHAVGLCDLSPSKDPRTVFRNAWTALRFDYPHLAVTAEGDILTYVVPDERALLQWVDTTFFVESKDVTEDSLIAGFRQSSVPTCHVLSTSGSTSKVLLHLSHWRIDALGALHLLDRLFAHVSEGHARPALGSETPRLSPPFEAIVRSPIPTPDTTNKRMDDEFNNLIAHQPSIGLPFEGNATTLPNDSHTCTRVVGTEETKALVNACKQKDISVTAALHAALTLVTYALAPPEARTRTYTSPTPLSLRQYLPEPYSGAEHAVSLYLSGVQITMPPGKKFLALARSFKEWYDSSKDPNWLVDVRERAVRFGGLLTAKRPEEWGMPSQPMLNSLGIVERYVQSERDGVRIDDVRVGVEVLSPENVIYVWTFQGSLHISTNYNKGYHTPASVDKVMEEVLSVLSKELDVDLLH